MVRGVVALPQFVLTERQNANSLSRICSRKSLVSLLRLRIRSSHKPQYSPILSQNQSNRAIMKRIPLPLSRRGSRINTMPDCHHLSTRQIYDGVPEYHRFRRTVLSRSNPDQGPSRLVERQRNSTKRLRMQRLRGINSQLCNSTSGQIRMTLHTQ